jgi:FkbM family methyltransferase
MTPIITRPNTADVGICREVIDCDIYGIRSLHLRKNAWIVDLGAHIGAFSALATELFPEARVIAVEMDSSNTALLRKNIPACIHVIEAAVVGDRIPTGAATLLGSANTAGHFLTFDNAAGSETFIKGIPVRSIGATVRLDDLITEYAIDTVDLLKMDIEGAEYDVLTSLRSDAFSRIDRIVMELHPWAMPHDGEQLILDSLTAQFNVCVGAKGVGDQHIVVADRRKP